jgi:hypothetical protein
MCRRAQVAARLLLGNKRYNRAGLKFSQIILFSQLDAIMSENVVGRGDVKIKIG